MRSQHIELSPADAVAGIAAPEGSLRTLADAGSSLTASDRLLEDLWGVRLAPFGRRQRCAGGLLTLLFMLVAVALAIAEPSSGHGSSLLIAALVLVFAVSSRIEFPIGAGYVVPTQLFLIPLFVLAPPAYVPLMVVAAQFAATSFEALVGRNHADRLVDVGVDSWHSVGPALVFVAAGSPGPTEATWLLFAAAFVAQVLCEVATSSLRAWLGLGISPTLQFRVLGTVWLIDALLTPVAVVAASAATHSETRAAPLAPIGFAILLALLTRDRNARIDQAHARLEALRVERARLEVAVQRIGDAFASSLDLDALLAITLRAGIESLDAEGGRATAYNPVGQRLVRRATVNEVGDADADAALGAAERAALVSSELSVVVVNAVHAIACPVRAPGSAECSGVLALVSRHGAFPERKRQLMAYLADQAGVAAGNIDRHEVLHRQALTDELTGLANHRRLQEVLALGADSYEIAGSSLALVLFDLDDFKVVNDTRGHQSGDDVLKAVSGVLRASCRAGDEAARYGGEELAMLLHGVTLAEAVAVAEQTRLAIAALQLVDAKGADLRVTTSVGVAEFTSSIQDPSALIAAADAALYAAKHSGKNCVCVHTATCSPN